VSNSTTPSIGPSVTVTVDGVTPVFIIAKAEWFEMAGAVGDLCNFTIYLDGAELESCVVPLVQTTGNIAQGASVPAFHVPAAGTHTYAAGVSTQGVSGAAIQGFHCLVAATAVSA
jgi:hypothetical protein